MIVDFTARFQEARAHGFQLDPSYNLVSWEIITSMGLRPLVMILAALGAIWGFWHCTVPLVLGPKDPGRSSTVPKDKVDRCSVSLATECANSIARNRHWRPACPSRVR